MILPLNNCSQSKHIFDLQIQYNLWNPLDSVIHAYTLKTLTSEGHTQNSTGQ